MFQGLFMAFLLQIGTYSGALVQYERPGWFEYSPIQQPIYTELGMELETGPFFVQGRMRVDMYSDTLTNYSPFQNTYSIGGGLRLGPVEAGIRHTCFHPMSAYAFIYTQPQIVPRFEGGVNEIYLLFNPKRVRLF